MRAAAALLLALAADAAAQAPPSIFEPLRGSAACRLARSAPTLFHYEFADADRGGRTRDITAMFDSAGAPTLLVLLVQDSIAGRVHAVSVRFDGIPEGRYELMNERDSAAADTSQATVLADSAVLRSREFARQLWHRRCRR